MLHHLSALENEDIWIQEKEPDAQSTEYGKDLTMFFFSSFSLFFFFFSELKLN